MIDWGQGMKMRLECGGAGQTCTIECWNKLLTVTLGRISTIRLRQGGLHVSCHGVAKGDVSTLCIFPKSHTRRRPDLNKGNANERNSIPLHLCIPSAHQD